MVMLENLGNYHLIRTVNTIYNERFRELILKIRSKEEVLSQLDTKLTMANDPEVQSERELEKKYFDFLVATRIKMGLSWSPARIIPFCTDAGGRNSQQFAIYRLKQLYRAISKNCREAHTDPGNDEGYPVLKELFIDASRIYNEIRSNEYDYFIHYYMLINILNQVVLLRQCNTLTVSFIDYTGLHGQQPLPEISKEFINRTKSQIEDMVICRKSYENTSFKIKNICDEELAMLHYDFLVKHSKYLDEQIRDLLNQINACISSKSEKNEKRSNIK
jgi:hypothetical protein